MINHNKQILRQSRAPSGGVIPHQDRHQDHHLHDLISEVPPERGSIRTSASIRTRSPSTGVALKKCYKHLFSIAVLNIIENLNLIALDNIDNLVEVKEVCGLERLAIVAEAHAGQLPLCWSTGECKYRVFLAVQDSSIGDLVTH